MSVTPRPRWAPTARARQGLDLVDVHECRVEEQGSGMAVPELGDVQDTMIATHLAGNMNPVRASAWESADVVAMVNSWGEMPGQYSDVTATMAEVPRFASRRIRS